MLFPFNMNRKYQVCLGNGEPLSWREGSCKKGVGDKAEDTAWEQTALKVS